MVRIKKYLAHVRRRGPLAIAMALLCLLVCFAGWWLLPALDPAPYVSVAHSGQLLDSSGGRLYVSLSAADTWSLPQGDGGVNPYLEQATLAAEDQRFFRHHGVDGLAIARALGQNIRHAGVASGASTLTMQLVKLGGHDSRSVWGKVSQAIGALRLEKSLSKAEILAAYLNRAPYGMNLIGVEAAAWRYFGKSAQSLTLSEAALLAALPKAPSRLNPLAHPERARDRRNYVLRRMLKDGYIEAAVCERALATPVTVAWHDFPRSAPHLGVYYADALSRGESVKLTLDGGIQRNLEAQLPHYLKRFNGAITNGAVMVVDVSSGALLARVGSASFENTPGGGQVDGCRALRSPGSTLKPFLYGYAMAQQQLYPSEVLLDDVLDFGRYAPGNFDGIFNGPVTATEALRYSLNVPAVALLERVGVAGFHQFLRSEGLTSIDRKPSDYGLGLALGNCEVSLEDLSRLYLSVASLGRQNALRIESDGPRGGGERVLDGGISRLLYDMLVQPFPDDVSRGLQRREGNDPPVCWKTGTSTGYHDAWTFAFNQHYLVAVWLGNNDGRGARQLVGARAALPLAGAVFRGLPVTRGAAWPPSPAGKTVSLCATSGLPARETCPERTHLVLPKGMWTNRTCTLHVQSQTGLNVVASRPVQATEWDLSTVEARTVSPSGGSVGATMVRINSPPAGSAYVLSGVPQGDRIPLSVHGALSEPLHWFMDGRYLGKVDGGERLDWPLMPGEHTVTVQLVGGGSDSSTFTVLLPDDVETNPEDTGT